MGYTGPMNPNNILGVREGASANEVQSAFRKAALEHHPDLSASAEAAEAFIRIKEARDMLMEQASRYSTETAAEDVNSARQAAKRAATATAQAAYATQPVDDDMYDGMTEEEVVYVQELDRLARHYASRKLFGRLRESEEVKRHRKQLRVKDRRIEGKY